VLSTHLTHRNSNASKDRFMDDAACSTPLSRRRENGPTQSRQRAGRGGFKPVAARLRAGSLRQRVGREDGLTQLRVLTELQQGASYDTLLQVEMATRGPWPFTWASKSDKLPAFLAAVTRSAPRAGTA
jgi:hypothetical protein